MRHVALLLLVLSLPVRAANPPVTITVDAAASRRPIDDRIYGSSFADPAAITDLRIPLNRWGGNAVSRYNWIFSTANRCKDFYFINIPEAVSGDGSNGESADGFIGATFTAGAEPVMTIPMMGKLPNARAKKCSFRVSLYGAQDATAPLPYEDPDCGNGLQGGIRILDPNAWMHTSSIYGVQHQADWIQHLVDTWKTPARPAGVRYYSLDNEPSLWSFDHWDVRTTGATQAEVWAKMQEYGAAIKAKDPGALVTGPEEWGWSGYFWSGADLESKTSNDRNSHPGALPYVEWILKKAAEYDAQPGNGRLLDVFTLHYYPQELEFHEAGNFTTTAQEQRNRSTRSLWDPGYVDTSWIADTVRLIPRMKEWVATQYPGTLIGLTEYNWGGDGHINGGTAQADILGILGREGADIAVRWVTPSPSSYSYKAFKMYRNYDGAGSRFGNTSISAGGPNPDNVAVFGGIRSSDNALTLMIVTKAITDTTAWPATINLTNFVRRRGATAQMWQLNASNAITRIMPDITPSGSTLSLSVVHQGVTLLVLPGAAIPGPPTIQTATTGNGMATIAFTAPADDGGADITSYIATCQPGGHTASAPLSPIVVNGLTNGTMYDCSVVAVNAAGTGAPSAVLSIVPLAPPANLIATATSSTAASLSWSEVPGATGYHVYRSSGGGAFTPLSPSGPIAFIDSTLSANTTYLYKVLATGPSGPSGLSAVDAATTVAFADWPLTPGMFVKALHMTQSRTAVNAMRAAAGQPAQMFTDPVLGAGVTVKAAHLTELRSALDQARAAIGLLPVNYVDPVISDGTPIRAAHLADIHSGVR